MGVPTVEKIPVVHPIIKVAVILHGLREQLPEKIVIWSFFKTQLANIIEIDAEFLCTSLINQTASYSRNVRTNLGNLHTAP